MKVVYPHAQRPITPFKKPIETISTPITGSDNVLLCVSRDWLPVLRGCINILTDPIHWKGSSADIDYSIQQINQLIEDTTMSACDCVLACIEDNPQIINEIIDKQNGDPDKPLPESELGRDWVDGLGCDKDGLWSACQYVIDGLFDSTTEVLQRIALATVPAKAMSEALDDIPIIGFVTNAGALVNLIADTAYDAWYAADSQAVRDEFACELLCYADQDCAINYNMLEHVLSRWTIDLWLEPLSLEAMIDWLDAIIFSSQPAKNVCATLSMLGLYVIKHGGQFGEWLFSTRSLEQLARLGMEHNPNSSWSVLCTTCDMLLIVRFDNPDDTNFEIVDFGDTGHFASFYNEKGNNAPCLESVNWHDVAGGQYQWDIHVKIPLPNPSTVTQVSYDGWYDAGNDGQTYHGIHLYDSGDNLINTYYYIPTLTKGQWNLINFTGFSESNVDYIIIDMSRSSNSPQATWAHYLDNVKVYYS